MFGNSHPLYERRLRDRRVRDSAQAVIEAADAILSGEPVVLLIGSYPSMREANVPGVWAFKQRLWQMLWQAEPHLEPLLKKDNGPDSDIVLEELDLVPFEALFAIALESNSVELSPLLDVYALGAYAPFHKLIAELTAKFDNIEVVTTNFDTLFEQAGMPTARYSEASFRDLSSHPLWKIHGTAGTRPEERESVIYTLRQTTRGLGESREKFLRDRRGRCRFIYIGYGANDLDIVPILEATNRPDAKDVWLLRDAGWRETEARFAASVDTQRQRELCSGSGGFLHTKGYEEFCSQLAPRLGLAYSPPAVGSVPPTHWEQIFDRMGRVIATQPGSVAKYVGALLLWSGLPEQAVKAIAPLRHRDPAIIEFHGQAAFIQGRLSSAKRFYQKALAKTPTTDTPARVRLLSRIGEADGNRWNPVYGWGYSSAAVAIGTLSPRRSDPSVREEVAWARTRRAQGYRQAARLIRASFRKAWFLGLPALLLPISTAFESARRRELRLARQILWAVGNEYGVQSTVRNELRVEDSSPDEVFLANSTAGARFEWIGRPLEAVYTWRTLIELGSRFPTDTFNWKGEDRLGIDLALELARRSVAVCEKCQAWTPLLKASLDLAKLSPCDAERRKALALAEYSLNNAELGLFGRVQTSAVERLRTVTSPGCRNHAGSRNTSLRSGRNRP